ncbi:hypothetical protein RclHR1_09150006 [Rhizophagus clarus]|uniref:Uncharacterized protein n=1 Tax=Rhizophagus clarus TaxID=94130 RepID=A0A2Z6SDU7_9GLOM|nr:hypothetical protein RclHR1_09150006 [Rhizophagus clarus]GES86387.1 hypothetical protein GLOIN_2v1801701 [Rhizophagus clarus]
MGTRSIILIRKRYPKEISSATKSFLKGPDESQYIYEYFVYMYQETDNDDMGEWIAEFLCNFLRDYSSKYMDAGFLAAKFVEAFMDRDTSCKCLLPLAPLDELYHYEHHEIYFITTDSARKFFDDKSIVLTLHRNCIISAWPEKFMTKYLQNAERMKESRIQNEVIDYGDKELEKEGYLAEDRLLTKFLNKKFNMQHRR